MPTSYLINSQLELGDAYGGTYELRLPHWGRSLRATEYQVRLLQRFEQPSSITAMLQLYPFHRTESTEFLNLCVTEHLLLPLDDDGQPCIPYLKPTELTIFGAPSHRSDAPAAFTVAGVPLDTNTTGSPGARFGPEAIRAASEGCRYGLDPATLSPRGFIDFSSGRNLLAGITIADAGDVNLNVGEAPEIVYDRITNAAYELFESKTIPIFLGGDHSITYPILRGVPHEEIGIIHFDAHTDLGEVEAAGLHHGNVFSVVLDKLEFVTSIYQIGLRGLYEANPEHRHKRVSWFGMDDVRTKPTSALLDTIPAGRPYYLSVDIDVLDPAFAPSTGTPVAGGLFPHELKHLLRVVCEAREIMGMDVVEVGPSLGVADSTASIALEAMLTMADSSVVRLTRGAAQEG